MKEVGQIYREARSRRWGDRFLVEGRHNVEALLENRERFEIESVLVEEGRHEDLELTEDLRRETADRESLEALTGYPFHRGVLACVRRPEPRGLDRGGGALRGTLVVAAGLADESNLGAVVRSAAAFGACAVVVPFRKGADPLAPKAIRASSGAVFRLPIYQSPSLIEDLRGLRGKGFTLWGTGLSAAACDLGEVEPEPDQVILFGGEAEGLSREWIDLCDRLIRLPMRGGMDSLNVSCCAAVVLWELLGKRRS